MQQRVARGGHDIPRADIERRYVRGRLNLIRLLPKLRQALVYDNSAPADIDAPTRVAPRLLLRWLTAPLPGPPTCRGHPRGPSLLLLLRSSWIGVGAPRYGHSVARSTCHRRFGNRSSGTQVKSPASAGLLTWSWRT